MCERVYTYVCIYKVYIAISVYLSIIGFKPNMLSVQDRALYFAEFVRNFQSLSMSDKSCLDNTY